MSWFSGLCKAGYLLKRLAMKARFNLGFPRTTSVAVTNCRQPSLSACCSMHSALWMSSFSCNEKDVKRLGQGSIHIRARITWSSRVLWMRQVLTRAGPYYIYHKHASNEVTGSVTKTKGPSSFNKFRWTAGCILKGTAGKSDILYAALNYSQVLGFLWL